MSFFANHPRLLTLMALLALLWSGLHFSARRTPPAVPHHYVSSRAAKQATLRPPVRNAQKKTQSQQITSGVPTAFAFESLIAGRTPLRTETRQFQSQKWEPDLAKALDLPKNTPLQRRSALFHIPELKFPLVRVDRIYRMDRQVNITAPKTDAKLTGAAALDAPGGELLWDNAMIADHLMVQTQLGVSQSQLQRALPSPCRILNAVNAEKGLYLVAVPSDGERSLERATLALNHESLKKTIWFAEPDFLMGGADTTADDPLFTTNVADLTKQWALPKIMAPRAWDVIKQPSTTTIGNTTVVAIVDTGVDYTHPDLSPNMYVNPGESGSGKETNGIDDDGNGKIDDYRGWNFVENNNNPMDDVGHGTHVAGIIGAVGNNTTGATGVCWGVKMLSLRIIKKVGLGTYGVYSDAVAAMDYIRTLNSPNKRVAVANHSWGGSGYSLAMLNAINNPVASADPLPTGITCSYSREMNSILVSGAAGEIAKIKVGMSICGTSIPANARVTMVTGSNIVLSDYTSAARINDVLTFANVERPKQYGTVHVAAAGNSRFNADRIPVYPANLPSGFILCVGASDADDAVAVWSGGAGSNFGSKNVDIFAPGSTIWSTKWKAPTDPSYGYESRNGTSMAAPHVTGALALLRFWQPSLSALQARQIIIDQAERSESLSTKCVSGGRLNVAKVLDKVYSPSLLGSGGSTSGTGGTAYSLQSAQAITGRLASGPDSNHVLFVNQGEVWSWGANSSGQLGDGTLLDKSTPIKIAGLNEVTMVATASSSSFALRADGSVWSWGGNPSGVLGLGHTNNIIANRTPQQVPNLSNISWISAGGSTCLAIRSDGALFIWGANNTGQLGDGTTTFRSSPYQVTGIPPILQADLSSDHVLAVDTSGQVYGWGVRGAGYNQLGDGNVTANALTPITVPIAGVSFVEAGGGFSLFLKADGSVWSTGRIIMSYSYSPTQVMGLQQIEIINAGGNHALAMNSEGKLFSWGNGRSGQLGLGKPVDFLLTPREVSLPNGLSVMAFCGSRISSFLLDEHGTVYSCGSNSKGLLGLSVIPERRFPVRHYELDAAIRLGAAGRARWAQHPERGFLMWGEINGRIASTDEYGSIQLPSPYPIPSPASPIIDIATPISPGAVALLEDGNLIKWGQYIDTYSATPSPVYGIGNVVKISSGHGFMLAILSDTTVSAWGRNDSGQLGDGTTTTRNVPGSVSSLSNVVQISGGTAHSLALKDDGTVWAWGNNIYGQLGTGDTTASSVPVQVPGLPPISKIGTVGPGDLGINSINGTSFALSTSGILYGWGSNGFSILGTGGSKLSPTVIYAPSLNPIVDFIVQPQVVVVLLQDGSLYSWGTDAFTAREPGSTASSSTPGPVYGGTSVSKIVSGNWYGSVLFQKTDGSAWVWAGEDNSTTGLGDSFSAQFVPITTFGGTSSSVSSLGTGDLADSWLFQSFSVNELLEEAIVGDAADPDGDGISNLLEYALGLDARSPIRSGLPTLRTDLVAPSAQSESSNNQLSLFSVNDCCGGTAPAAELISGKRYPVFTVNRSSGIRLDLNYYIEVSEDLQLWRSAPLYIIKTLDTAETLEAYSALPLDEAPNQFMRLRVERK